MADVAAQLDDVLRGGEVDLAHLIAAPERFGELGRNAERASIGTLVQSDPKLPDGTPDDGAWQRLGIDPATTLGELDADRRAWMADLLRFWRRVARGMIRTT